MQTWNRTAVLLALAAFVGMIATAAQADLIIDDFDAPANPQLTVIAAIDPDPTLIETADAGIEGGERDLLLDVMGAAKLTSYSGTIGGGDWVYNCGSPGVAATLQYDGVDVDSVGPPAALVNSEGLGGIDLTAYGSGLFLDFESVDGGQAQVTNIEIEVHDGATSATFAGGIADAGAPFRYVAKFADFSQPAVFTNVTSIEIRLNPGGATDVDFTLDAVGVPEPAALSLLVVGGLLAVRRRRR